MGLREEIDSASLQRITLDILIAGQRQRDVLTWNVSLGYDQQNGTATVAFPERPSVAEEGAELVIWVGYNGYTKQVFSGEIGGIGWSHFPGEVRAESRDVLYKTRFPWGGDDRVYTAQDDAAVIVNLLEACGIMAHSIDSSSWTLGSIQDVVLARGQTPWALIEQIDRDAGYSTWCGPDGVVYRRRVSGAPGPSGAVTLVKGQHILSISRRRDVPGIVNTAIVRGLTYEGVEVEGSASAPNTYLPDPPGSATETVQSDLIETDAKAVEVAQRIVGDKNRRPEGLEIACIGDPYLLPGITVAVNYSEVETGDALLFVQGVQHAGTNASYTTTITTSGGTLSGYNASAPIASFDLELFQEAAQPSSGGAVSSRVVARATFTGFDPDHPEEDLTYSWSITPTGGSATAITSTTARDAAWLLGSGVTSVSVTLTVTDPTALSDSVTIAKVLEDSRSFEALYAVDDGDMLATDDGGLTWNDDTSATVTCLAPFGADWGNIYGSSNGHIYATNDMLETAAIDLGQPHGAVSVTAVWVHELSTERLWAAFSDGAVYFGALDSAAMTATWEYRGTLGASVVEIRESYGDFGYLRATAGQGYYESSNGGITWTELDSGDTASRMAAGLGNFYAFLNDADPLREEGGLAITLPVLIPPVTHVRGLTVGWRRPWLYAVDDQARLLGGEITGSGATLTHLASAPAGVNHMIRSGNEGGAAYDVIYLATDDGIAKWFGGTAAPFFIRQQGTTVAMVGYGDSRSLRIVYDYEIIYAPSGETGGSANDKIKRYVPGVGYVNITPPVNGRTWFYLRCAPTNPDLLLLIGNSVASLNIPISAGVLTCADGFSPAYISDDGGATWTALTLATDDGGVATATVDIMGCWSTNDRWAIAVGINSPQRIQYWMGNTSGAVTGHFISAGAGGYPGGIADGLNGDIIIGIDDRAGAASGGVAYVAHDSSTLVVPGTLPGSAIPGFLVDRLGGLFREVHFGQVSSGRTSDYRTFQPSNDSDTAVDAISASAAYIYGVESNDLYRRAPGGTYALLRAGLGSSGYRGVRVDRQRRQSLVLPGVNTTILAGFDVSDDDGATWATIPAPSGSPKAPQANAFEIIMREVAQ